MSFYNPQERQNSHENLFAELQNIKIYKAKNARNKMGNLQKHICLERLRHTSLITLGR